MLIERVKEKRPNYKNVEIWKIALEIAYFNSYILESFPKKGQYNLTSQISRCSISITSNVTAGLVRTNKSFSHFIDIFLGSSFELSTQIIIAKHKNIFQNKRLMN
ncbi:four helix bundle protein [Patiriisocius sp. Uisw_017]|uniref:four helix bundle protein n=1 Tax=Patiriisocius sp. Uisw_017 TaxID=3230968 RepID=UPI0039E9C2CC